MLKALKADDLAKYDNLQSLVKAGDKQPKVNEVKSLDPVGFVKREESAPPKNSKDYKIQIDEFTESKSGRKKKGLDIEFKDKEGNFTGVIQAEDMGGGTLQIHNASVDRLKTGGGVGTELYKKLIEEAKAKGYTKLVSDASVSSPARSIWKKLGGNKTKVKTEKTKGTINEDQPDSVNEFTVDDSPLYSFDLAPLKVKKTPDLEDTRGKGRFFHGASSEVKEVKSDMYTTQNIYGQGFYTTDAVDIASGYTRKGRGVQPTLHEIDIPDVKIKSMEEPLDKEFVDFANNEMQDDLLDEALGENPKNLRELYDEVRSWSEGADVSADEVQGIFDSIQYYYSQKGFGGFEHKGGLITGKKEHTVRIYFPDSKLNIKKLDESTVTKKMVAAAAAGVATTAQADDNSPSLWNKRTSDDSISYNLRESINSALNSLEATKFTTYVPKDEKGVVIGKSGITIAKGFDLGQVDLAGLKKLNFSESLFNKLSKYVGYKGQEALDFLNKEGSVELTKEEVKEINSKVGEREEKKLVENFKKYTGRDFDKEPKNVQQALMLASYQVGSGLFMNPDKEDEEGKVIEKGKLTKLTQQLIDKDYEAAGDNLYNWNNKSKKGLVKRYRLQGKIMKGELDPSDIDAFNLESENTLNLLNEKEDEGKNIYTISSGDGLGEIAKKFNTTVENLMKLNNIKNKHDIKAGAKLKTK